MGWHAKPSGGYGYNSTEGRANIEQINGILNELGFTLESQAGILGNIVAESALNPWRWQGDTVNLSGGYGLVQFTPASDYIGSMQHLDGYGPNLSASYQTEDARPEDGYAQMLCIANDYLGKWVSYCWRDYWSTASYPALWAQRNRIVQQYGTGSALTLSQFKSITNVGDATLAFLACFEGPAVPNYQTRYESAAAIYEYLSGGVTPDPPDPGPTPTEKVSINTILEGRREWVYSWHGAGEYNVGDTVIIGCVPYHNYKLVGWFDENGNLVTTDYQYSFTAEINRTFTAIVVEKPEKAYWLLKKIADENRGYKYLY